MIPVSFIQREADKLGRVLREAPDGERHAELRAAKQALAWASEPQGFASPFDYIMGIRRDSEGCQEYPCHSQS